MLVRDFGRAPDVFHDSKEIRRLNDHGRGFVVDLAFQIGSVERSGFARRSRTQPPACPGAARTCSRTSRYSGCTVRGNQNAVAAGDPHGHHGRFRHRGRAVVHGSVGHFHAGQLADHGLKFEDGGQRALRDFGLIGRVGRQEFAARDHGVHQHRPVMMIDAGAQERCVSVGVFVAAGAEVVDDFVLGFSRCDASGRFSRTSGGRCENRSSREFAPIADSISRRSRSDFGK